MIYEFAATSVVIESVGLNDLSSGWCLALVSLCAIMSADVLKFMAHRLQTHETKRRSSAKCSFSVTRLIK